MKTIHILLVNLAVWILCSAAYAQGVEEVDVISIGDLEVYAITDAHTSMEGSLLPDLLAHPELQPLFEHGALSAVAKTYLVRLGGHTVLVDTGWGSEQKIKGQTLEKLAQLGIKPENITDIIFTHLDHDHTGGLSKDGKAIFPKATIWISQPEYDVWMSGKIEKRPEASIARAQSIPVLYKDRIKTFTWGEQILPGITAVDASGHTPGHTAFDIESNKEKLTIAGDLIHIAQVQLAHPEMSAVYDIDMKKAAESRKRLLRRAADEIAQFGGMHFQMISPVRAGEDGAFFMRQPR